MKRTIPLCVVVVLLCLIACSYQVTRRCRNPLPPLIRGLSSRCPTKVEARTTLTVDQFNCQRRQQTHCCGPLVSNLSRCFRNPKRCRTDSIKQTRFCTLDPPNCCCKGSPFSTRQSCDSRAGVRAGAPRNLFNLFNEEPTCEQLSLDMCGNAVEVESRLPPSEICFNSTQYNCTRDLSDTSFSTSCVCDTADLIEDESTDQVVYNYQLCFYGQCFSNDIYYVPDPSVPVLKLRAPNPTVVKGEYGCEDDIDGSYSGRPDGYKTCSGGDLYESVDCRWEKRSCPQSSEGGSQCRPDVFNQANCVIDDGRWYEECMPVISGRTDCVDPFPNGTLRCSEDDEALARCYGSNSIICINGTWVEDPCPSGTQCRDGVCDPTDCLLFEPCTLPDAPKCGSSICEEDERCCNGTCFNPLENNCINETVCPFDFFECSGQCYSTNTSYCTDEGLLCYNGEFVCGQICYNDTELQCFNDTLCFLDEKICDGQCYNPNDTVCYNNRTLCASGEQVCGLQCYDPQLQVCIRGKLCPAGHNLCRNACYNPKAYTCIEGTLCPVNHQLCGKDCYQTSRYSCCTRGSSKSLCQKGQERTCCPGGTLE